MPTAAAADGSPKEWVFEIVGSTELNETSRPIDFENPGCLSANAIRRKREILFEALVPITSFLNPDSFDVVYFRITRRTRLGGETAEK